MIRMRFRCVGMIPWLTMLLLAACADTHRVTITQPPSAQGQPLPVEFVYNLPVINASIGGQNVRLIVDLGGHDALALKKQVIERLPTITMSSRRQATFNAAGKVTIDRGLIAPELKIGDLSITDVHGRELELPPRLAEQVDGYIGAAMLKRFRLLVDYPRRMALYPADGPLPDLGHSAWTPVRFNDRLRTSAAVDGRTITAGWDTGASHTVIDDDLAQSMFGVSTGAVQATITLDGHAFDPLELRVIELRGTGVDVLMGHNFFQRHRALYDFAAHIAYIEPARPDR